MEVRRHSVKKIRIPEARELSDVLGLSADSYALSRLVRSRLLRRFMKTPTLTADRIVAMAPKAVDISRAFFLERSMINGTHS
jgi:hypothetical protein